MTRHALAAVLALSFAGAARAAGPYDDLLKFAPADTNVLALIDVKGAFSSPLAKKENWAEKALADNRGGLGFVPTDAETVVIAAWVNFNTLVRDSQFSLVKVRNVPTLDEIAKREGGSIDEIGGRLAVLSPRNVYFTTFSGSELASVYPADRQYTARWIKSAKAGQAAPLSPYLKRAAEKAAGNTVTIALDLEDVVDKNILKFSLAASPSVAKNKNVDLANLAGFLAQVKGLTFSAKVGETITGTISVEFPIEPARHRKTLPDLLLELFDGEGIWIDGLETWEVKFTDTAMTFTGPMTTADLKRVVSLFAFPATGRDATDVKGNEVSVPATKRYLKAVESIVDDVRTTRESPNYEKTATWHDKAATQIEHLSRKGVDPAAVDAALKVGKRLHAIADSLRGVPINVDALASTQYVFSQPSIGMMPGGWWGWQPFIFGPTKVDTNIPQVQAEIARVIADDKKKRTETWSEINRILDSTKKTLSDKHKTPF